jgi:hypothetical protein
VTSKAFISVVFFCATVTAAAATEGIDLQPRYDPARYSKLDRTIDPDGLVYGFKFGATEKEVLDALGVPNGVIAISDTRKALLYGKSHLFIFRGGKFRELRIGEHVINWELARQMDGNPFFDRGDWVVKPGIRNGMSFEEVQKVLNRPGAAPDYKFSYDTKETSVSLSFSSYTRPGGPGEYKLMGLSIMSFGQ